MAALESPPLENRPSVGSAGAVTEAMNTGPASFFGLIGTFRHKNTSLHQGIIGVPKYGVKEWSRRDYSIYYLRGRHSRRTSEGQTVVWLPEIVKTLQTQLTDRKSVV